MRKMIVLLIVALLASTVVYAQSAENGRNFDRRLEYNAGFQVEPSESQRHAAARLAKDIPGVQVRFDSISGVCRSVMNPTGFLTEADSSKMGRAARAIQFAQNLRDLIGITPADLATAVLSDLVHSDATGGTNIYLRQAHWGIEAHNCQLHVNMDRDGRITGLSNAFMSDLARAVNTRRPSIGAAAAVRSAAAHLGLPTGDVSVVSAQRRNPRNTVLTASGVSNDEINAKLMWLAVRAGEARLVWNVQLWTADSLHLFDMNIDAVDGSVWTSFDLANEGSYRVFKQPDESPLHGTMGRALVVNPELSGPSPNGWFTGGTMDGNNVHACPDASPANNACDSNPQCSGTTCDFALNLSQQPSSYIPAATANLFYWNNYIHDTQYLYGFDEAAGNFQEDNFGRGGAGSDSVNADAQDGSGNCNANFATPSGWH